MPEVKMDFIPDDMTDDEDEISRASEEIEEFNEYKDKETGEENPNFIYSDEEDLIKKVVPKAKSKRDEMNINEIFNMPQQSQVEEANVKLTKKGKPRKKRPPMSEEHKAKLALAREKAMESRKKKAQERKENKALETEEKELLKKQKVKRVNQLKEEVLEEPTKINKESSFSKKDLEDAQLQAIMNYEKIRKQRKEKKRIEQEKNKEEEMLKAQLRQAVAPPKQEYNPFSGCY
jgi:acyl transferase domain-containing protein